MTATKPENLGLVSLPPSQGIPPNFSPNWSYVLECTHHHNRCSPSRSRCWQTPRISRRFVRLCLVCVFRCVSCVLKHAWIKGWHLSMTLELDNASQHQLLKTKTLDSVAIYSHRIMFRQGIDILSTAIYSCIPAYPLLPKMVLASTIILLLFLCSRLFDHIHLGSRPFLGHLNVGSRLLLNRAHGLVVHPFLIWLETFTRRGGHRKDISISEIGVLSLSFKVEADIGKVSLFQKALEHVAWWIPRGR